MYAKLNNDGEVERVGLPPGSARRVDTGEWVSPHGGEWPDELAIACGWVPITDPGAPEFDRDTETRTYTYQVNGARTVVTKVWTVGPLPADKIEERARANERRARLTAGVPGNPSVAGLAELVQDLIEELGIR